MWTSGISFKMGHSESKPHRHQEATQWEQPKGAFHTRPPSSHVSSKEPPPSTNKATLSFLLRKKVVPVRIEYDNHWAFTIFHLESKPNCILFCIFLSPKLYFRHLFVNYSYIQWACVYVSQRKEYLRRPYPWVSPNPVLLSSQEYNCTKNGKNAEMLKGWGPVEKWCLRLREYHDPTQRKSA